MNQKNKKISIIGLGKLGACYSAFYASKGLPTLGYDTNELNVTAINEGRSPVVEPGLAELIKENRGQIEATTDVGRLITESDITFLIVPTPSQKNGLFSVDYVVSAAKAIGPHLKKKKGYHVFVLVSTVLPGDSRSTIIPAFEKYSGKKRGKDFGYVYSPSLIAIGDILKNLENPDFLFMGSYDDKSREVVTSIYGEIYPEKPIEHGSIESMELAKISLNSYVTMKITFANILGELSSKIPHADVDEVTRALGKDRRIGAAYLKSGLGYGGPCFPRDNFAFAGMAKKYGIKSPLALATHNLNNKIWKGYLSEILEASSGTKTTIGVLGIAYKPNTILAEESQALLITKGLIEQGRHIILYEPLGHRESERILKNKVTYSMSLGDTVKKSDVVFVSNFDKVFTKIPGLLKNIKMKKVIIDPWGMFTQKDFSKHVTYISLGRKR